jgi:hypothetical protein
MAEKGEKMNDTNMPKLEARVNTGQNDECVICNRSKKRKRKQMETYIAGTENWVCFACSAQIDEPLCHFVYHANTQHPELWKYGETIDGNCPVCGSYGPDLWAGWDIWKICEKHGLRHFSHTYPFKYRTVKPGEDRMRNQKSLARFRKIMYVPRPRTEDAAAAEADS